MFFKTLNTTFSSIRLNKWKWSYTLRPDLLGQFDFQSRRPEEWLYQKNISMNRSPMNLLTTCEDYMCASLILPG